MNLLDKVFGILLALVVLFLAPAIYLSQQATGVNQYVVNEAAMSFVEQARTTGYITPELYLELVERLDATGELYRISLQHSAYQTSPVFGETGEVERVGEYFVATYEEEIWNTLQAGENYEMNPDDYLSIEIRSRRGRTLRDRMLGTIFATYGGRIRGKAEL